MLFFKRRSQHPSSSLTVSSQSPVHQSDGYLQGQLLVSTPMITGSCFHQSVVLLFAHNDEGAMGVIVNQPMERVDYGSLLEEEPMPAFAENEELDVYYGGPVDRARGFVIHSNDYDNDDVIFRGDYVSVSANTNILRDMVQELGPRHTLLAVGYAGWAPGQLEKEIEENSWITVPATPELIFQLDDDMKWGMASQSLGIDMNFYSPMVGHA